MKEVKIDGQYKTDGGGIVRSADKLLRGVEDKHDEQFINSLTDCIHTVMRTEPKWAFEREGLEYRMPLKDTVIIDVPKLIEVITDFQNKHKD